MSDEKLPRVFAVDGQLVIDDPQALAMVRAVAKVNCRKMLDLNAGRVEHFEARVQDLGYAPTEYAIVVINVDDPHGGPIANLLMPNYDWAPVRAAGLHPIARGLAQRAGLAEVVDLFDGEAAEKMRTLPGLVVVVIDHGVAEVYPVGPHER